MSFGGADYRQAIILAVENQGTAAIDQLRASMRVVQEQIEGWNRAVEAGTTSTTTYISAVAKLNQVYDDLRQAVVAARTAEGDAQRARIDALVREEQAFESLRAQLGRNADAMQAEANAAAWMTRQATTLDAALKGLAEDEQFCATATVQLGTSMKDAAAHAAGYASAADMNLQKSRAMAYAFLNVSHAAQDLTQSGLSAVVNNIPLMTQSIITAVPALDKLAAGMGGAAGVAGAAMFAGVAFDLLYTHWGKLNDLFNIGVPRPILDTTAELGRKLKEAKDVTDDLGKKSNLTIGELAQYRKATQDVKDFNAELERRRDLEAMLSGKSKAERERATAFKEAVAESADPLGALDTAIGQHAVGGKVFNEFTGKNSTPRELAERMIGAAGEGDLRARNQIVELLNLAYKPTEGSFASNITKTAPETVAAQKAAEKAEDLRAKVSAQMRRDMEEGAKIQEREAATDLNARVALAEEHVREKTQAYNEAQRRAGADQRADQRAANLDADPARQRRQAAMAYGQEFQSRAMKEGVPVSGPQATAAGRDVAAMVGNGADVDSAMRQALANLGGLVRRQNMAALRNAAAWEQMNGIVGEAAMQLQMVEQQQRRAQQRRPTLNRH